MTAPLNHTLSPDQEQALAHVGATLAAAGIDLGSGRVDPPGNADTSAIAVLGKAGSGKTMLLAHLYESLRDMGVQIVSGDYEPRKGPDRRSLAILAPTNKAASVLRLRGVPATTIHRILYTPVYNPEYEKIAEWLAGTSTRQTRGRGAEPGGFGTGQGVL